ncbi:HAMP domain-containing histidine kinase [Telmatocola sphagniphila]|uniref:histidine kinase n=1 Tax=Telmatocola sphagniphila TaxID=1123043 RepID=A0A8E6B7V2_9BACT|nr:HAMP domain-containing sensor histidine kinase [Telmatocola sphagniphila]QVL32874.1 HAMP domain-containing histidine kinase [Telmatocola sphagniphila]
MSSIRQRTVVGIVLMLICTLGVVCFLVYRMSKNALEEKNSAIRNLLKLQFEDKRDEAILAEARSFATLAELKVTFRAGPMPDTISPVPNKVSFKEDQLSRSLEESQNEFLQLKSESRDLTTWISKSLEQAQTSLPSPSILLAPYEHYYSEAKLGERNIRMVTLQVPIDHYISVDARAQFLINRFSSSIIGGTAAWYAILPPSPTPSRSQTPPQPPSGPRSNAGVVKRTTPMVTIQVGWDEDNHPTIQRLLRNTEDEADTFKAEGEATLSRLKLSLIGIGLLTLLAATLGVGLIITQGLKPLRRLSEAVSQVSEKDFNLPLKSESMPLEVYPTVEKLRTTLDLLRRAFEREKQATADISHELRTPIASLNATLDVALKKPRSVSEYQEVLQDCRMIGKEMGGLVERIMALAYLDAGADHVKTEEVDASKLLGVCGAISKPLAEAQGLKFQLKLDSDLKLRTDPDKLREVVMNLLHNAIEYNKPGGEIELSAKSWGKNGLEVDVRDTGIGISPDLKDKIFERFYRVDPSRTNTGVHAGLGLAIVKEYVSRLGGTLELASQVGQGSQFKICIPNR